MRSHKLFSEISQLNRPIANYALSVRIDDLERNLLLRKFHYSVKSQESYLPL